MWWRLFIPTWRFFDSVGPHPQLLVKKDQQWEVFLKQPKLYWYSLFFNPQGSFYHACNNLLDRLIEEVSDGQNPKETVSYALVRDLVGGADFKITLKGEMILRSGDS
jgi:hypothetical protein